MGLSLAALIRLDTEDVARAVYDAMRFERRDKTPEWVEGGNSNAQVEARATAARILAALEAAAPPDLVGGVDLPGDLRDDNGDSSDDNGGKSDE